MRRTWRDRTGALLVWVLLGGTGCSLPALLKENTQQVRASTAGIANNTGVVRQSTEVTRELLPAMQGLQKLEEPMKAVAGLGPSLGSVAALDEPMKRVAALDAPMRDVAGLSPDMRAVSRLDGPMNRVAAMRPSLDAVSALSTPMERVAALGTELRAVAELQGSMRELAALREPMTRVAELRQPMDRLAAFVPASHPLGIVLIALLGLGLWGVVTFVAVRLAIVSALGRGASRGNR